MLLESVISGVLVIMVGAMGAWTYAINSRVTVLETKENALAILLAARENWLKDLLTEKFDNIGDRLKRIESKLEVHAEQ